MTNKLKMLTLLQKLLAIINYLLYNKKVPVMPSLLVDENFVSDFDKKAFLLNNFFASASTPIKNTTTLPLFS